MPLAQGYPDPKLYVFDAGNADDIAEKLLSGERLLQGPLIWNLRPAEFEGYFDEAASSLHLYSGKIYLPDSHHRQQGILKAVRTFNEEPGAYPSFSLSKEFNIELYFLSKDDEGNHFYDKNQRPKPTSTAFSILLSTGTRTLSGFFLKKKPPCTFFRRRQVNRQCSSHCGRRGSGQLCR